MDLRIREKTVLLIGRPGGYADGLREILASISCKVKMAADLDRAREIFDDTMPDMVIICDDLGGSDPAVVCEWIKGHPAYRVVPVVMIVPVAGSEEKLACLEAGADEVLIKPVEKRELLASVIRAIKLQRLVDHQVSSENVIRSLNIAIEEKDHYTRGHSIRVAEYSVQLAKALGLSEADVEIIYRAAMLHDIGQIAIEESVLHKPGALSEKEMMTMRQHPAIAIKILEPLQFPQELLDIVLHHHEWWNGHGYPYGLARNKIPVGARILSIADAFDAMTSERPYRAKMGMAMALTRIEDGSGRQWDPDMVTAFLSIERAVLSKKSTEYSPANLWDSFKT